MRGARRSRISGWFDHRVIAFTVVASALSIARVSAAAEQFSFQPAAILAAGADDNLLFDGTGGDRVGRGGLRFDLKTWDRLWTLSLDAGASVYGFQERQKLVPLGESTLNVKVLLGHMDAFYARARVRGSDDPLGLAQIGLLGAAGAVIGYRSSMELEHFFDARWSLSSIATFDGIGYLDQSFTQDSGEAAGVSFVPTFRFSRDLTLQLNLGERTFFNQDVTAFSIDALPGVRYRAARRFFLEVDAGPTVFRDTSGLVPLPVLRSSIEYDDRLIGLRLTASQDLTVPSGRAGVLTMQLVEAMGHYGTNAWEFRVRGGYYRSLSSPRAVEWTPGYGLQVEAYRRVASFAWVGISGLRFERLPTPFLAAMARDAIYAQIELTAGRP